MEKNNQKIMEKASSARVTGIPAVWPEAWGGAGRKSEQLVAAPPSWSQD